MVGFAEMQVVYSQLQLAGCSRTKVAGFLWKWAELGGGVAPEGGSCSSRRGRS